MLCRIFVSSLIVLCQSACGSVVKPVPVQSSDAADAGGRAAASGGTAGAAGVAGTGIGLSGAGAVGVQVAAAGQPARSDAPQGGSVAADAGPPTECMRSLDASGCPVTYDEAIAPEDCSHGGNPFAQASTAECAAGRTVSAFQVDVGTTCVYDASDRLVWFSTCSKPIGRCNCFYGGSSSDIGPCKEATPLEVCEQDAGVN